MAKLGYLYLHKGLWKPSGQQLVPATWVDLSTDVHTLDQTGTGYGYQWWSQPVDISGETVRIPYAVGWGGQRIYIVDPLDMVVVMTAEGYLGEVIRRGEILLDFLFPAADPGQVYGSPDKENGFGIHDHM
jgi:CubicO group peptidase (beta-lactamase class C family)